MAMALALITGMQYTSSHFLPHARALPGSPPCLPCMRLPPTACASACSCHLEMLVHGNMERKQALALAKNVSIYYYLGAWGS